MKYNLDNIVDVCELSMSLIDHTSLNIDDNEDRIKQLICDAKSCTPQPAAVCVYSKWIPYIKERYPDIRVAVVVNFPTGEEPLDDVISCVRTVVSNHADEIDLVINYKTILINPTQGFNDAKYLVEAVRALCSNKVILKVIIESGELKTPESIKLATQAALEGGADFVKTSTGKVLVNATLPAAQVMLETIRDFMIAESKKGKKRMIGFKAAGGVKTPEQCQNYLQLAQRIMKDIPEWKLSPETFRFGASSLLSILKTRKETGSLVAEGDSAY